MKVATILYHKNILSIYREEWIKQCIESIKNQTFTDFIVYEVNYGDDDLNLGEKYGFKQTHHFYKEKLNNHAEAMNFLFDKCLADNVDVVVNNNMDDFSDVNRFEIQLSKIKEGYDIVSSNFQYISEDGILGNKMNMSVYDPIIEFNNEHNIICHPSVCYSRKFIENNRYDGDEIPAEDFKLWKRTIDNYKFYICSEYLINYRFHKNQITTSNSIKNDDFKYEDQTKIIFQELNIVVNEDINKREIVTNKPTEVYIEPITVRIPGRSLCSCGEPINKIKYNFCQKCNKLY